MTDAVEVSRADTSAFQAGEAGSTPADRSLVVAPCSHAAARYAVERWHYAAALPTGKLVKLGAWEGGRFIGAVIFSRGASPFLGHAYGFDSTELCELTRVALRDHVSPVSQIVAAALRVLARTNPGLRLVVSFADPTRGHHGGIYQAGNWLYAGQSNEVVEYRIGGRWRHTRGAYHHPARRSAPRRVAPGKHRYLYPLDRRARKAVAHLALPYPPRQDNRDGG